MGQKTSSPIVTTLFNVMSRHTPVRNRDSAQKELQQAMSQYQTNDFLPDAFTDVMILVLSGLGLMGMVFMWIIRGRIRTLERRSQEDDRYVRNRLAGKQLANIIQPASTALVME